MQNPYCHSERCEESLNHFSRTFVFYQISSIFVEVKLTAYENQD